MRGHSICNVVTYITLLFILQHLICLNAGETGYFFKNNVLDTLSGYLCKNEIRRRQCNVLHDYVHIDIQIGIINSNAQINFALHHFYGTLQFTL